MKYLFMKINNKIKVLATRAQKKGICFKANDNVRSIVSVPERYRNNETVVFKLDGEKCYVTATDLVVFFVFKQFWSASGYISKYYKVVFDGYDFQISEASSQAEGFYSDKSGMYFDGMLSYHIIDVGSTGKSSIQLAFSFDGENAFTITKNIPDLTIDYAYYSSESLNFEDVAFDSDGYIYITLFLTLRVNSSSSSQVFEYRQYLCCSKFDDDSPFEILRNTYEGTHEYVLEENYFSEGAVFKEYHQTAGGSMVLYKTSVYSKGIEIGNSAPNDWRYFGPALNYREDSEGNGYRQDSQNVWQKESTKQGNFNPYFFYSPFTDCYYVLEVDGYNIYYYTRQGKTLPAFPSMDGFTTKVKLPTISDSAANTRIRSFTHIPSYHRQS